ncbi:molybdenum cofactor guanylyltransferase [Myxococcus stipitatus]|uniref:molybdenum cofactor guanylyltransferase n=1 Tax=Myxococcus stipitatus TaxID=83455 RepID=UPI001F30EFEB|nr:molybdenum cofactor guanylyltransferase [Myxococcus stipitatus]MCE9668346.1 molybdenum cofactor guanylyltransferase [Myxococcus stipitatus]
MDPRGPGPLDGAYSDVTLAIIAGGQGRRLSGVAKGLLEVEGRAVVERLVDLSRGLGDVLLVANAPAPYARFGVRAVADVVRDRGAPGGVHAALVASRTPWVATVACDMPFVAAEALRVLLDARSDAVDSVCFEVDGRVEPLLAVHRASLAPAWEALLVEEPSLRQLMARGRVAALPERALRAVDPTLRSLVNVNTPEDLARHGVSLPR